MNILVNGKTDKGRVRANNEDNLYLDEKGGLLVVADGMGGHASKRTGRHWWENTGKNILKRQIISALP